MEFIKYKILIEKITSVDVTKQEYQKIADTGNERDNGPTYGYVKFPSVEYRSTEVLKMESEDKKLDLKNIVKAILGM